jgi:peptide/nickel transport system substrate-binding protein
MKQIIHPIFKSNEDGNIKFQAGELDIMQQFVSQIWKMWEGGKPVGTYLKDKPYFVPGSMPMLLMNTTKKGLDNPAVRKAIASAIDYASIAETAMSGYSAEVQPSLILPTGAEGKFFNKDDAAANGWKFDAAAAEKLLTDAGAKKGSDGVYVLDGTRLGQYKLITPTGWTDWNAACEIVAKSLKAIGIDCVTNFPQQAETTQAIQGGTFDLACWYVSGVNPATPWARFKDIMSQSEMQPVGKTTFANYSRWKNADVEALLTEASQAVEDTAKKAAYDKLDALYRKEIPACPLMYRPDEFYEYNASNFYNFPDEKNTYAPPMFRGAGNTWMYKLKKIAG